MIAWRRGPRACREGFTIEAPSTGPVPPLSRGSRKVDRRHRTLPRSDPVTSPARPGLAKTRELPLFVARHAFLLRAPDPRWRELFASADAISEGGARRERVGRVWYGSTSLILTTPVEDAPLLAALAARDVHVRLRAIRSARREACLRAPAPLGRIACEVRFATDPRGVRIDVDVQAPLIEGCLRTGRTLRASGRSTR